MDICPFCKNSLNNGSHKTVGFMGNSDECLIWWECFKRGGKFSRRLKGQAAKEAHSEYYGSGFQETDSSLDSIFG